MSRFVYLNGKLLAEAEARISPFDHGLTTGDGVFETLRIYEGRAFAIRRHWERLKRSATALGIDAPELGSLREGIEQVIAANQTGGGRLRITLTAGPAPLGSEKGEAPATLLLASSPMPTISEWAKLVVVPYRRNEQGALSGHKSTSYGENVVALARAKHEGGTEAIFGNTSGELCEGSGSNIFLVEDGTVLTPPLSSGCLPGITRALVLELCQQLSIPFREEPIPLKALNEGREAFLTSTLKEVQPVVSVDGKALGQCPGRTSEELRGAFRELVAREIDP